MPSVTTYFKNQQLHPRDDTYRPNNECKMVWSFLIKKEGGMEFHRILDRVTLAKVTKVIRRSKWGVIRRSNSV